MTGCFPILAASLSGVAFAVVGVAYRLAQPRRFSPAHLIALCGLTGTLFFGLQPAPQVPTFVLVLAVLSGLSQYTAIRLVAPALRLGPLSPMWCALSLGFVPSALYAFFVYGKPISLGQTAGITLATLAVLVGALQHKSDGAAVRTHPLRYGLVLVGLFVANSFINVTMADLKAHPGYGVNLLEAHGNRFMAIMYLAIGICAWIDLGWFWLQSATKGVPPYPWAPFLGLSLLAAVGSNAGLLLVRLSGDLSPAITFTLSGMISLLAAALVSVAFFRERPSFQWTAMMAMAATSVPLVNLT